MMIATLLVVASSVAFIISAEPIFFDLFDYDMCEDCDNDSSDIFSSFACDLFCESVEECETTTTGTISATPELSTTKSVISSSPQGGGGSATSSSEVKSTSSIKPSPTSTTAATTTTK